MLLESFQDLIRFCMLLTFHKSKEKIRAYIFYKANYNISVCPNMTFQIRMWIMILSSKEQRPHLKYFSGTENCL